MDNSDRLVHILSSAGILPGSTLVIEAPRLDSGLAEFVAALGQVIGPQGTCVVPTCTHREGYPKPTFDPLLSPSEVGPFSEFFRLRPGTVRSHSPTHSVAAIGLAAQEIVAGHRSASGRPTPWGDGPFGHNSPWDVLAQQNAWWILLDADWDESPFTSYVAALYAESHQGITKDMPFPKFSGPALEQSLERADLLYQTTWAGCQLIIFRMQAAIQFALDTLEREPEQLKPESQFQAWAASAHNIRQNGYLQAGTSKVVISPSLPCSRWEGKRLSGIYRDLYARSLVLQRGHHKMALVSCDLLGIAGYLTTRVREGVEKRTGFPGHAIMLACTHAHSTPDTLGAGNQDTLYLDTLVSTIVEGICQAIQNTQPARLGWGRVPIRGLAQSRRVKMKDGRVYTTRYGVPSTWRVQPDLIADHGPVDQDLTVVRVENLAGEVLAVVSNFGCHPSVALMSPNVSGDYAGEAMWALERALGSSAVALFTNGTAADVDPTLEMPFWGPRTDANAQHLGRIFAAQVLECLERVPVGDEAVVGAVQQDIVLPVRQDWIHMIEAEQARLRQEFASVSTQNPVITPILQERIIRTQVQVLRFNDLVFAGFPGEVFTTTGLKLKSAVPERKVCVVELANDCAGYLLTPEAEQEGGYETGPHFYTRVRSEAEQLLLDSTRRLIASVLSGAASTQ